MEPTHQNPMLLLIRHAMPRILPETPASEWCLSEEGKQRCAPLADRLASYAPDIVISSTECKAVETAQLVAERLRKSVEIVEDLHEHDRSNVKWSRSVEHFQAQVAMFFQMPGQMVFGSETADAAFNRFQHAIKAVIAGHPGQNIAVVTHGTVMTLFIARQAGLEPFPFWKRLGLPAFVALVLPTFRVEEVVEEIS